MTFSMQRIGQYKESDQASAMKERDHKDATDLIIGGGQEMDEQNTVSVVRRLVPTECARLQGYPDDWVEIGDWTDSKGKLHKDADSPKYRALGNSICLPYWQYLARRICAQYERPITMGSLFDGIGGFPLVFQRAGAIPVWASEIEEFCIAVTKKHFGEEEDGR
jgi:DNA (cytosine-5)-methyltransferase 1